MVLAKFKAPADFRYIRGQEILSEAASAVWLISFLSMQGRKTRLQSNQLASQLSFVLSNLA